MSRQRPISKLGRTPGERAFDRCFLPVAILPVATVFTLNIVSIFITWKTHPPYKPPCKSDAIATPPSASVWLGWLSFGIGILLVVLWIRALVTLIGAWNDPSSKLLRFSALMLLIPFAAIALLLLQAPFH